MPNVSQKSETNLSTNDLSEVDELETDVSSMEPTSPLPATSHATQTTTTTTKKPEPGSTEWYEIRKENHKKVERRRRETINQAMDDLVAVIPGNEKNKSRILRRAVQHIKQLVEQVMVLRQEIDEYRQTNHQQQMEITELKARLDIQQQQQPASRPIEIPGSS